MKFKDKQKCNNCKKLTKRLYSVGNNFLCWDCYKKTKNFIHFPIKNNFEESINKSILVQTNITSKQKKFLEKRIKSLKLKKAEYFRMLLINDMESLNE
jgi:hypothetical protein